MNKDVFSVIFNLWFSLVVVVVWFDIRLILVSAFILLEFFFLRLYKILVTVFQRLMQWTSSIWVNAFTIEMKKTNEKECIIMKVFWRRPHQYKHRKPDGKCNNDDDCKWWLKTTKMINAFHFAAMSVAFGLLCGISSSGTFA